jgi:hypothetical protein
MCATRTQTCLCVPRSLVEHFNHSLVLALAHCYHSRLETADLRQQYREAVVRSSGCSRSHSDMQQYIKQQQRDLVSKMELPAGTALNTALLENVFVILVCVLNKIPVFLVGKPGCSKSLSMQLIRSNLRGPDSRAAFFKDKPQVLIFSFQGSESSTSEGVEKVFVSAKDAGDENKGAGTGMLPVVLLDEVRRRARPGFGRGGVTERGRRARRWAWPSCRCTTRSKCCTLCWSRASRTTGPRWPWSASPTGTSTAPR